MPVPESGATTRRLRRPAGLGPRAVVRVLFGTVVVTPPMFAIPFGLAGLSGCWRALGESGATVVADGLTALSALLTVVLAIPWFAQLVRRRTRLGVELSDPARGPSVPVVAITAMLLSATGLRAWSILGPTLVEVFAVLAVAGGVAVVSAWLVTRLPLRGYHPGFYLPTAGGSLLAAQGMAGLGREGLAQSLFFVGLASWLILGVVTTARLVHTPLPLALRPVMVIELAAPALAGNTYVVVFGRFDVYCVLLTAVTVLMAVLQVVLVPYYRRAPLGPASWSAAFSYATAAALALRWVDHGAPAGAVLLRALALALATAVVVRLSVATLAAGHRGRFVPQDPALERVR